MKTEIDYLTEELEHTTARIAELEAKLSKQSQNIDMTVHSCSYFCDNPPCIKQQRDEMRAEMEAMQEKLASRDQQMRRWNYVRDKLAWADCRDGNVRWVMYMEMPVPDISAENLTATSVKEELDTAIDEALRGEHE